MGSNIKGAVSEQKIGHRTRTPRNANPQSAPPPQETGFQAALSTALEAGDVRLARTLVAEEEARLFDATTGSGEAAANVLSGAEIAAAKARIALATGDGTAAHAILLAAMEATPQNGSLRVLMSEVMLATGRASDVRPVLQHIGKRTTDREDGSNSASDAS